MVNKNYSRIMSLGLGASTVTLKSYSNDDVFSSINNISSAFKKDSLATDYDTSTTGCSIFIGSGNTAASIDDIKLDTIMSSYAVIAQTHTLITTYSDTSFVVTRTIQNTTSDPLTITEIGLFGFYNLLFMFAREVLDEPFILQPGKKHTFTMTIGLE